MAYIDTGATLCFGKRNIARNWQRLEKPLRIVVADKSVHEIWFVLRNPTILIENHRFPAKTIYLHDSGLDLIIGNNFLKLYHPFTQGLKTVSLRCPTLENQKSKLISTKIFSRNEVLKLHLEGISETLNAIRFYKTIEETLDEVCSDDPLDKIKNNNDQLVSIKLKDPNQEVNIVNRIPYSISDKEEFRKECDELLAKGIIRESCSPHSAPAFYVENHNEVKRGKRRMVINYKKMNEATIGDSYKLPRKDYILECIKGAKWFSSLDAKSGYWQLRLDESTKPLTAFSCPPQKHYEWNVMPFGLKQAPAIYQAFMDRSLAGLDEFCLAYIDDIIIFTKSPSQDDHVEKLKIVLDRIKDKGIIISKKKSKIVQKEIEYLGLHLGENGTIKLSSHIQEKIALFPDKLEDRKQIQRFLGCLNYVADQGFLKKLATQRASLQKKISPKVPWSWTETDTNTVSLIKRDIQVIPELYNPEQCDFLIVETDASDNVWSGCLLAVPNGKSILSLDAEGRIGKSKSSGNKSDEAVQPTPSECGKTVGELSSNRKVPTDQSLKSSDLRYSDALPSTKALKTRLCRYVSGTFTPTEMKYPIHQKETLACLRVLTKWKVELLPTRFELRVDSSYVAGFWRYTLKEDHCRGRLINWQLKLHQFEPFIRRIKSEDNSLADTLTREWSPSSSS